MGKHQSVQPHGQELAVPPHLGMSQVNTAGSLQRQWAFKLGFQEILKLYCESYRTWPSDALSLCDANYVYLENTGGS